MRPLELDVRAGLDTGEVEVLDGKVAGIAVNIGARVAARAGAGEVLVAGTVKDLVAGSGLEFEDRGVAELKGVPGEVAALRRRRLTRRSRSFPPPERVRRLDEGEMRERLWEVADEPPAFGVVLLRDEP